MAVEIGTATNYLDLAQKLKTFLTTDATLVGLGQEWICNRDDGSCMLFQGPGLSGAEEVFIGIEMFSNEGDDIYSWDVTAFTGYNASVSFAEQPGRHAYYDSFLPLWDDEIPYWFVANGQRVIVIAKVSTTYQSMYLGKFLSYATPQQYPYPVFWGGMASQDSQRFSNTTLQFFPAPIASAAFIFQPSGSLIQATTAEAPSATSFNMYPWATSRLNVGNTFARVATFDNGDSVLIKNIIRFGSVSSSEMALLGELDGVYWIHGNGQSSESIITADGHDHLVFQNGSKTEVNSFAAVRLV